MDRRCVLRGLITIPLVDFSEAAVEALAMSEDGLVTISSNHSVKETLDRLVDDLKSKNITVFARVDHAAGAASVGMPLRPTELLIFGNPKAGTPLMQSNQTIGIDLPLKVLGWEDAWVAERHRLSPATHANVEALATALGNLARAAAT
jgi:uncharacterized protein (DUF302 family)